MNDSAVSPQAVFLQHESWLRTVVRSRLSEPDAVEDVMQNIALAIVRQRHTLHEINRLTAWLYQVAVRQVLMYRRTTGRRRRMQDRLLGKGQSTGGKSLVSPVDQVISAESQENVRRALEELPELDRQILMLKYTEQWSYRQLAEHLGVREDTVEYRLLKARKNLKRLLLHYLGEDSSSCT